jgi:hypothetical protein
MSQPNPYAPPSASLTETFLSEQPGVAARLVSGQRMMIIALVLYLVAGFLGPAIGKLAAGLVAISALILGIVGAIRLSRALGFGIGLQIACFIMLFIPLVNLLTILILNRKATERLRNQGYQVGLLGAKRPA